MVALAMSAQPAAGAAAKRLVLQRGALPALALLTAVLAVGGLWLGPPRRMGSAPRTASFQPEP